MEITEDYILNHRVRLRQPKKGYRAGMDAVFLAASVPAGPGDVILDLGTGVGAAALATLARVPGSSAVGLEREAEIAALALENAALNAMAERFTVQVGAIPEVRFEPIYDAVLANPPYYAEHAHTHAAAGYKKSAHVLETDVPLAAWVEVAASAVKPGGTVTFIYPARQEETLRRLFLKHFQQIAFLELRSYAESPEALRVLIQGRTTAEAPAAQIQHPPIILHQGGGAATPEAEAVLRQAAATVLGAPQKTLEF